MRPARLASALASLVIALPVLTACTDQTGRYCAELEDQQKALADLALGSRDPGPELYPELLGLWRELQEEAPDDLADEWSTLVFAMEGFLEAVERTGATPESFDPDRPPPGATESEVAAARDAAEKLVAPRVFSAAESVQQHARDVCKTDLSLTGGGDP